MVHPSNKRWPVIQDILKREGIARQHLNSFDEFLERGLQSIINEVGQIDIENAEYPYKIQLGKVKLQQPRMMELDGSITHITPAEARLRNVSYSAPVMMEASVIEDGKILESRFVHIGDVPVMAKSNACILNNFSNSKLIDYGEDPNDPGGYFIINGSERVIVGLEDLSYNKIIVDRETLGGNIVFKAKVYSSIVGYRAKLELVMKNDGLIVARIPGSPVDIPVVTLMRALGLESDREIAAAVSLVDTAGDGLAAYNSTTGVFTFNTDKSVLNLTDVTDANYTGKAEYLLQVNAGETGMALVNPLSVFTSNWRQTIDGDGSAVTFALTQSTDQANSMVFVGGVIQDPTTHYTINDTNNTITFNSGMPVGTSAVVIAHQSGLTPVLTTGQVTTDKLASNIKAYIQGSDVAATTGGSVIDTFAKATYRTAKYIMQIECAGEFETREALVVHNGTTAYITEFAIVYTGAALLGDATVAVNGGNIEVSYTAASSNTTVKVISTYIDV